MTRPWLHQTGTTCATEPATLLTRVHTLPTRSTSQIWPRHTGTSFTCYTRLAPGTSSLTTPILLVSPAVVLRSRSSTNLRNIDFCSEKMLSGWKEDKLNTTTSDEMLDNYIKLYNDCMSGAPADMHFGVHLCRGKSSIVAIAKRTYSDIKQVTSSMLTTSPRVATIVLLSSSSTSSTLPHTTLSTTLHVQVASSH